MRVETFGDGSCCSLRFHCGLSGGFFIRGGEFGKLKSSLASRAKVASPGEDVNPTIGVELHTDAKRININHIN